MVKIEVKVLKVGNSLRIAIPKEIRVVSGIKEGDLLLIDYDESSGKITLEKKSH